MSREKQIEEMAGFIYGLPMCTKDDCDFVAKLLIGEGYRKQSGLTPCDVCRFNPPTSRDNAPCTICPAQAKMLGGETDE